jgi:hypothetical protein
VKREKGERKKISKGEIKERQDTEKKTMHVECNNRARSCNHCCSGNAIGITYSKCVCVGSLIYLARNEHAPCCHLWSVRLYIILPYYLIKGTIYEKKKNY